MKRLRCAIYTRKSSEEGLEQEFNSLDAQREACAAYVASQKNEGWVLLADEYDDGGLSGGTMDRPALQRLMADIDAGRVDQIVVYKIDRLTRSLADFAKIVERLDAAGASFVSVTQSFNTATSMGRLTLNMLLSFAQFEREVTAERIRDKIAASKKRGLWMGGVPPLGYDAHPDPNTRSLVINEAERATVEALYALYDELGCLRAVDEEAARQNLRSKRHVFSTGREQGGGPLSRGQIHHILCNPIYAGRIRHKNEVFDGQHAAIIEAGLWDRVQVKLQEASARPRRRRVTESGGQQSSVAPLTGKFRDPTGDRLTPSHTRKNKRRIRYYVSNRLLSHPDPTGWRLPAGRFEASVAVTIADHIERSATRHALLSSPDLGAGTKLGDSAAGLAARLRAGETELVSFIVQGGQVQSDHISITMNPAGLAELLQIAPDDLAETALTLTAPFEIRRRGVETKLVVGNVTPAPDRTLLRALLKAHKWAADLKSGRSISEVARREKVSEAYIRTRAHRPRISRCGKVARLSWRVQSRFVANRVGRKTMIFEGKMMHIFVNKISQKSLDCQQK